MDIKIFQSYHGDCLLIESASGHHRILCDGGTPDAMTDFIAPELAKLHAENKAIDLVYVSHIDQDHIGGVLRLLEAALDWKVRDEVHADDPPLEAPPQRVPQIKAIWHNAFRDLIKDNAGEIENLLAASARGFQSSHVPELVHLGREYAQIAASVKEALKVSRLIRSDLLDIPLNKLASSANAGKLLMARKTQPPEEFGSLKVTILAPTAAELEDLRTGWDNWLRDPDNRKAARAIRDQYVQSLSALATTPGVNPLDLGGWNDVPAYKRVTAPNVASLVLMVEEGKKKLLLTGDSHPDKIIAGLEHGGFMKNGGDPKKTFAHIDVLKFQHHGSEHNMTTEFGRRVSADHYVFCGNGEHSNPEIEVLDAVLASRVGPPAKRALSPEGSDPNRAFHFWFNTTSASQHSADTVEHMELVEQWAAEKTQELNGLLEVHWVEDAFATLTV